MPVPGSAQQPSPERFFEVMNAYQQTAALKAAIELDLFTAIGEGAETAPALAQRCRASERGTRILCDYLVAIGDRKSTRLNSSHSQISYAVFCLKKKKKKSTSPTELRDTHATPTTRCPHPTRTSEPQSPTSTTTCMQVDTHTA